MRTQDQIKRELRYCELCIVAGFEFYKKIRSEILKELIEVQLKEFNRN